MNIIFVTTPKGGAGKTTVSELLAGACELDGQRVVVLDADAGNRGYRRRCGPASAISLDWGADPATAERLVKDRLARADTIIVDFGANLLASNTSILELLHEIQRILSARGYRIWTMAVASPNAPGTDALVESMIDRFGQVGTVIIVENDIDGSGSFPIGFAAASVARVRLGRIEPGIVAARMQRQEPLAAVLTKPDPDYTIATAMIARTLLVFMSQKPLSDLVGRSVPDRLGPIASACNRSHYFAINQLAQASDTAIDANRRMHDAVLRLNYCSADDAWATILAYRAARAACV